MRISDWSSDVCSSDLRGLDDLERWLNFGEQATERGDQKLQADDAEHRREGPDFSDAERHLLLIAVDIMDRRVQRYLKVGSMQERVGQLMDARAREADFAEAWQVRVAFLRKILTDRKST